MLLARLIFKFKLKKSHNMNFFYSKLKHSALLAALLFSHLVAASTLIISDIDDTIKDSEVLHKKRALKKVLRSDLQFLGMNSLYHTVMADLKTKEEPVSIVYLSNAPEKGIGKFHRYFIKKNKFPQGEVLLRRKLFDKHHKFNSIDYLLKTQKPTHVILIGDNGQDDAKIYKEVEVKLFDKYNVKSFNTFIRYAYPKRSAGSDVFSNQTFFLTAGDIALSLYRKDVLSRESTAKLLEVNNQYFSAPHALNDFGLPNWIDCREFYQKGLSVFQQTLSSTEQEFFYPYIKSNLKSLDDKCSKFDFLDEELENELGDELEVEID